MMKETKITDFESKSSYTIWEGEDFEKVNPVQQIAKTFIEATVLINKFFIKSYNMEMPSESILLKKATEEWGENYKKYLSTYLPERLFTLLDTDSKKEQIKSLKGISLTTDEFISFVLKSYEKHGYYFSEYTSSHQQNGVNEKELPILFHKEDNGDLISIGNTNLSEGQLIQAIDHRSVIVAKFLDKGDKWHCFFFTYKSLKGEEISYKNGQPHLHYISHTWGLSRDYVVAQLKSRNYQLPSLPHIDYHTHRNPRQS